MESNNLKPIEPIACVFVDDFMICSSIEMDIWEELRKRKIKINITKQR